MCESTAPDSPEFRTQYSIGPSDSGSAVATTGPSQTSDGDSDSPQQSSTADHPAASAGRPFSLRINLASCKYPVLRVVQRQLGWVEVADEEAHVFWCDTSAGTERLVRLARPQKLNHFPGMLELARKKGLARNLEAMRALFPEHYDFNPRTFLLPEMAEAFQAELAGGRGRDKPTYILKLDNGSMGRGIKLVQTAAQAAAALPTFDHSNVVASRYIANPLLIDGRKFDLRIYVLVRSCDPLRIFICREGLVRFCTEPYEPPSTANLDNAFAHLTNYALNKRNPAFVFNQDVEEAGTGSKWTLGAFADWMQQAGHDFEGLWRQIQHVVVKSLISIQPMLQFQYNAATRPDDDGLTCFELLGYDILIDNTMRPWLLEVNHSPSLSTDTPLDLDIKARLVTQALALAGVQPHRIRAELEARERARARRLYTGHASCMAHAAAGVGPPRGGSSVACDSGVCSLRSSCGGSARSARTSEAAGAAPDGEGKEAIGQRGAGLCAAAAAAARLAQVGDASTTGSCRGSANSGSSVCSAACAAAGPASEPERGTSEWVSAQVAYEDGHLGSFERIMPPEDPVLGALYERLLAGALQAFYRHTMQGRNQQKLIEIRERRQQEEAEALARQDAMQRRAESLKAWMAGVIQKHREERELKAAAATAAEAEAASAAAALAGSGPDADMVAAGSWPSRQQQQQQQQQQLPLDCWGRADDCSTVDGDASWPPHHFAAARQALPSSCANKAGQADGGRAQGPAWRAGRAANGGRVQSGSPRQDRAGSIAGAGIGLSICGIPVASAAAAECTGPVSTTNARISSSASGTKSATSMRSPSVASQDAAGSGGNSSCPSTAPTRRPLSSGPLSSRQASITVESVIEQRKAAAAAAAAEADASEQGQQGLMASRQTTCSAALEAWATASRTCSTEPAGSMSAAAAAACSALATLQDAGARQAQQQQKQRQVQGQQQQPGQAGPVPLWQQQAWDEHGGGLQHSHFLRRVATFTQCSAQAAAQAELAALSIQGNMGVAASTASGAAWGAAGRCDVQAAGGLAASSSAAGARLATPDVGKAGSAAVIMAPPARPSELHTVCMMPSLLGSAHISHTAVQAPCRRAPAAVEPKEQHAAAAAAVVGDARAQAAAAAGGQPVLGRAAVGSPWLHQTGSPAAKPSALPALPPAHQQQAALRAGQPAAARAKHCSPSAAAAAVGSPRPGRQAVASKGQRQAAVTARVGGNAGGSGMCGSKGSRQQYHETLHQAAVQSVAVLVAEVIHDRGL